MKTILILLLLLQPLILKAQQDSIKVFVIGNKPNESYKFYGNGEIALKFKSGYSYKYAFNIFRDSTLIEHQSVLRIVGVYKKSLFGYKRIGISPVYENKRYLVIWRNVRLRKRFSFDHYWTNDEPEKPYGHPKR